jgi:hypothetical protein
MKEQGVVFNKEDLEQIRGMGLTPEKVLAQIERRFQERGGISKGHFLPVLDRNPGNKMHREG